MSRSGIYYWKCDRPAAFHGTEERGASNEQIEQQLFDAMRERLGSNRITLKVAASQGNHLTWAAEVDGRPMFVRVENGPEHDDYIETESAVMQQVRGIGVPVPQVFAVDGTRTLVPFAWQAMERVRFPDLNHWHKLGTLNQERIAFDIGAAVARWQAIEPKGFGPFAQHRPSLIGFHARYEDYFRLRLDEHLSFLVTKLFITAGQRREIERAIDDHQALLQLNQGCLVHKDLALWNILGSQDRIAAFIDFDDAISGDAMDDLSLLGCFHDGAFLNRTLEGYQGVRVLPGEHRRRFWLHLLRNMIVKAVIRVGAGYFDRSDGFFLIGSGSSGADLRQFTHSRLSKALHSLREDDDIGDL
jgi:aminoglycoside phosphotransferase (APT) family kinase protein